MLLKNFRAYLQFKPALAMGFLLSVNSLLLGIWVAALPALKQRLGFTEGSLGLSLLLSPLGAITGVFLSTRIFRVIPVGRWMLFGYSFVCLAKVLEVNAVNRPMFWCCLYAFGLVSFLNGVSVNTTLSALEQRHHRLFMSTSHALYSLGGALSAGLAALLFGFRLASGWQIILVAAAILFTLWRIRGYLLMHREIIHSGSGLQLPSLQVLGIAFICLVIFLTEGCVADWSALYLKDELQAPPALISLGYAGFSVAMTIGRLNGDGIVARTGNRKAVISGCILAALGFALVVPAHSLWLSVTGFVMVGLGCSTIVPVLFRTAAGIPGVSRVQGFAMVTTGGLLGFLAGPSLIGFIAEAAGLSRGFILVVVLTALAALVAGRNRFLAASALPGSQA